MAYPFRSPMTRSEWSKFHRLVSYGNAKLAVASSTSSPFGHDEREASLVLTFDPPLVATFGPFAGVANTKGEITHVRLSAGGLDLRVKVDGETGCRTSVRISQVIAVEQRL